MSALLLIVCVAITRRSRRSASHAAAFVTSLMPTSGRNTHRHGVGSKIAISAATTAKQAVMAKPLQIPSHSFGRFAGAAISAMNGASRAIESRPTRARLGLAEELAHRRQQRDEIEWLGQVALGQRADLVRTARLIAIAVHRAHQEDRRPLAVRAALDLAAQLEPVLAGELDIHEEQ